MPILPAVADFYRTVTAEADPAKRWLTTRDNVKTALRIDDEDYDGLIDKLIPRVSGLIAAHCCLDRDVAGSIPNFARETLQATYRCGRRGPELVLPWRVPVTEIVEIVEDGTTLDPSTAYRQVSPRPGRIERLSSGALTCWSPAAIVVTFKAGFALPDGVDPVLEAAAIEQLRGMVFGADRDPAIVSESDPDLVSTTYSQPGGNTLGALSAPYLSPATRDMLAPFVNPLP